MPLVKEVSVNVKATGVEDAKLKISEVDVAAKKLERDNPTITPQIEAQKALLQARLLREGIKAELSRVTEDVSVKSGGNGNLFQRGIFSALDNAPAGGGSFLTNPAALAGIAVAVGALLPEIAGVVSGFAAATAGAGAFYLLAHPAINNLTQDYKSLNTAESALQLAQNKYKIDPTTTTLKALQTAQLNLKAVQMSVGQDAGSAVGQLQKLADTWHRVTNAFQPTAFKVFGDGLKVVRDLLPAVVPMATAFGGAIDKLLKQLDKFVQSKGFQTWLGQFDKLIGPSIGAIGTGIGKVIIAFGKLLTVMSSKDVARSINIVFDAIAGTIDGLRWVIIHLMHNWDDLSQRVATAWHAIVRATNIAVTTILNVIGTVVNGAAKAFGWIPGIGPQLRKAAGEFNAFEAQVTGSLAGISGAASSTSAALAAVGYAAVNAFNKSALVPTAGNATPHAAGGPAGGLILVGERGPEVLQVPTGSYVYNNQQARGMLGGGNTYNINVAVPVSANKRDVGRQVVEAIRAFEHGSGSGWRK